jgi:hypothetical protein
MTETRLLDYAFQHPSMTQVQNSGAVGVLRYVCPAGAPKRITPDEAKQIRGAGLWLGLVFESTAARATEGHAAGLADARMAAQQAHDVGYPTTAPMFFAVDEDTSWASVNNYFTGVKDAHIPNPLGAYGSYNIVEGAHTAGIPYRWQTVAWSSGRTSGCAHIYQRNSSKQPVAGTDENVLLHPLPLWGAPTQSAQTASKPKPIVKDAPAQHGYPLPTGAVFHGPPNPVHHPALDTVYRYFNMPVPADHVFTAELAAKIGHFQSTHKISVPTNGVLDLKTWQAMT